MNVSTRPRPSPGTVWLLDVGPPSIHERRYSVLCIVDPYGFVCLAMEIQEAFRGDDIVRVLERVASVGGAPSVLKVDRGALFSDTAIMRWAADQGSQIVQVPVRNPCGKGLTELANRTAIERLRFPGTATSHRRRYDA